MSFFRYASLVFSAVLALSGATPPPAALPAQNEADAVRIVLTASPIPADLFAQSFLAQVPVSRLTPIRDQVTAPLGSFERAEGSSGQYTAYFSHGTLKVFIHLDEQHKIDSLLLRDPVVTSAKLSDASSQFDALEGSTGYLVLENGKPIAQKNAGTALGVGSTFKLAVLNALRKQIDAGTRKWSDAVKLQAQWKSLPSGVLQTWPDGTPLTLATLATEMISISDNTAADTLIHTVGPTALAPFAHGNAPFLTTREMFLLKTKGNEALRDRYRTGNAAQRRAVLAQIDKLPLPALSALNTDPALSDIEWHFSSRQLCALMQGVHDLPLMSVNPGVATPSQWKRVAYKGGSDFGVISMTTWLQAKNGKTYCASATWNTHAAPADETKFETIYALLLASLAHR